MSFSDDFNGCLQSTGLPAPGDVVDSVEDAVDFLHKLVLAGEASGGETEGTLAALAVVGGAVGIDEAVAAALAAAGTVTIAAYLSACASCIVVAAGSSIWDILTAPI